MWNIINKEQVQLALSLSNNDILITLTFTIFLTILWHYYLRRRAKTSKNPQLPPGPRGIPLLGFLPFLGRDLHHQFTGLASLYGPIFKFWLGNKLFVVLTDPSLVRELTRDKDTLFANHVLTVAGAISTQGGKDIAFTPHGRVWKKLRRVFVQEMMSNAALEGLRSLRAAEVRRSVADVFRRAGEAVDMGHLAFMTSANSMLRMLWGGSMDGEEAVAAAACSEEFRKAVWEILFLVGNPNVSDVFPALSWLDVQGIARETRRLTAMFERMFDSAIAQRQRVVSEIGGSGNNKMMMMKKNKNDFLQFLLKFQDDDKSEDSDTSITMAQLKATLMDPVVGGTQSTSATVEWTMAELLKHPDAMRKVQEEVTQVVGLSNMVEESHLSRLTYLQAVIKETLRLHPPFPLLVPRFPTQTTTLGGFKIPKNATVFINAWAIHRNPSLWEDPEEFRPERFIATSPSYEKCDYYGNNFNYIPFGSGRRMCPGIPLAEKMVPFALASFLHCFDWRLPADVDGKLDLSDKFGLATTKLVPLVAIPTPRLPNLDLCT